MQEVFADEWTTGPLHEIGDDAVLATTRLAGLVHAGVTPVMFALTPIGGRSMTSIAAFLGNGHG